MHRFHPSISLRVYLVVDYHPWVSNPLLGMSIYCLEGRAMWPGQVHFLALMTCIMSRTLVLLLIHSFVLWSSLDTPVFVLSIFLWAAARLCSKALVNVQVSDAQVIVAAHIDYTASFSSYSVFAFQDDFMVIETFQICLNSPVYFISHVCFK